MYKKGLNSDPKVWGKSSFTTRGGESQTKDELGNDQKDKANPLPLGGE